MLSMKLLSLQLMLTAFPIIALINTGSMDARKLQQDSTYFRANYSADFQYLRDTFCLGDAPTIEITCFGNLTILGTSDPSIQCTQLPTPDSFENGETHRCNSNCSGTECTGIYLNSDGVSIGDGPFGSIYFSCEGSTVQDVDAFMNYVGGNNGTCAAASGAVSFNYHIARLGVSCLSGSSRKYLYDDTYFECSYFNNAYFNTALGNDDIFTCSSGTFCGGLECDVPFSDVYIDADVPVFFESCVESNAPITAFPTPSPVSSSFTFSARFVASWGRLFDPIASASTCTSGNPAIVVSCESGASITYVNSTDEMMNCTNINAYELKCQGDETKIDNLFTNVTYDCIGPALPTARVTYPESTAFCNGNAATTLLRHVTTLGVVCNLTSGQVLYNNDYFFECAELNDQFNIEERGNYGLQENRYVCGRSATFPVGSLATNSQAISSAAIVTDDFWLTDTEPGCFDVMRAPSSPSAPTPPTPPATNTPMSSFPTPGTPVQETAAPAKKPTSTPVTAPIDGPAGSRSVPTTAPNDSSSNAGAIAGGTIVGIAIVAIIAFFLLRKRVPSDSSQHKPSGSGVDSSAQSNTVVNSVVASPYSAPSDSLATNVDNAPAPVQSFPTHTSYSATPMSSGGAFNVRFKDQARSVIGPSRSTAPMVVAGVPMAEAIPMAVAVDDSVVSGVSKNSIKSEPPGRRMEA